MSKQTPLNRSAGLPLSAYRIAVITAGGPYAWIIINSLGERFGPIDTIVEEGENRVTFLKRRARKIGWLLTAGQLATMVFLRLRKTVAASRSKEIVNQYRVRPNPDAHHRILKTSSINSCECHELLDHLQPKVVLLVGCRLLTKQNLATISCPVMNYHAGITPTYRGMNGGYFARALGDIGNFGATVHLVDDGVDTGAVLYQVRTEPNATDNISTYPMLLAAVSRDICIAAVGDALNQCLRPVTVDLPSRQWFHPPIWSYLWVGLTRRVW